MEDRNKKSVDMTFSALYSFVLNTNVKSVSGIFGIGLSIAAIVILIIYWNSLRSSSRVMYIIVALSFTVINPTLLAFKAWKQLKLNPFYKKPIEYEFTDEGITVRQGEAEQAIKWENICRLMMTKSMLAIYTSRIHAFVIPLSALGDDKARIISRIVSFTGEYRPAVSRSLKQYQSGKGI